MSAHLAQYAGIAVGVVIFVAAAVWPAIALVTQALVDGQPATPYSFPQGIFLRSVFLAFGGTLAALLLAMPGALVVARLGRRRLDGWIAGMLIAPLIFPVMVYAFGWDRVLKVPGELRCVWVWATWAWPVPALVLGWGWARLGRRRYEAALLSASPPPAFLHGVFPILWRQVLACGLLLFAFFLGDYTVPHACGLIVYATELLLAAESSPHPRAALVAALPVAAAIALSLLLALMVWRERPEIDESDDADLAASAGWSRWLAPLLTAICVGVPLVGLMHSVPVTASVAETLDTYCREIVVSLGVAAAGGVATVLMGAALATLPGVRWLALGWALVWAALPGALIGSSVISAYLRIPSVYDHWLIMVIGYVARFGWVGIVVGLLAQTGVGRAQLKSARIDGAGAVAASWRVALAGNLPTLACGALVVSALCLSEACTTALVRVPEVNPIALILIEKFHRFEDEILVGISLLLVLGALPGAVLAGVVSRR